MKQSLNLAHAWDMPDLPQYGPLAFRITSADGAALPAIRADLRDARSGCPWHRSAIVVGGVPARTVRHTGPTTFSAFLSPADPVNGCLKAPGRSP
jgi:hypothetical protein